MYTVALEKIASDMQIESRQRPWRDLLQIWAKLGEYHLSFSRVSFIILISK
jgi:hypothetical protein